MSELINKIEELPQQTADKIAAGEVVDRPISIVKELTENSIDAGASSITIEIQKGGKSYIRVTDNGCGIRKQEVELAFKRHATSKLKTVNDLNTLSTLGFRGEALASIAAVSRTELLTKTESESIGTSVNIEGGIIASITDTGCPTGTTVIVKDLFYNTPARLKFMKKDNAESSLIIDFISKMALAYPEIRIRLINNGNTLFTTPGKGDRFNAIATIFDPNTAKKLIRIHGTGDMDLSIEGYISPPDLTRANRKNQIFFFNGRYIQSKLLENAVTEAYREKLFEGRYPVIFLFISINPEFIDVNIHPNKREIRFDDENAVKDFVKNIIRQGLSTPEAVPEIKFRRDKEIETTKENPASSDFSQKSNSTKNEDSKTGLTSHDYRKQEQLDIRNILRNKRANEDAEVYQLQGKDSPDLSETSDLTYTGAPENQPADLEPKSPFSPSIEPKAPLKFDINAIKPIGAIFSSYILGYDENTFYMIDQHAAHERVFYEKLTREFYSQPRDGQFISVPIKVEVSHQIKNSEDDWIDFIKKIGFSIEEFGPKSYAVKQIPLYMSYKEAEDFLSDFFDNIADFPNFKDQKKIDKIIMQSCKSAVKANDHLDPAEIAQLLKDLAAASNPFSCPHGRPTIIKMTKREIEALFKR